MSQIQEATLLAALQQVVDPNTGRDLVSTRQLKNMRIQGDSVSFDVELGYPAASQIVDLDTALDDLESGRFVMGDHHVSVLVRADSPNLFCEACQHNRTIPDLSIAGNRIHWRKIEFATAYEASNNAAILARSQYQSGLIDFQTLSSSETTLLNARNSLASAQSDEILAIAQLYNALGGGWQNMDDRPHEQ